MALKTPRQRLLETALDLVHQAENVSRVGGLLHTGDIDELAIRAKVLRHAIDTFDHGLEVVDAIREPLESWVARAERGLPPPLPVDMDEARASVKRGLDAYYDEHHEGEFLCPCPECGPDDRAGGNT